MFSCKTLLSSHFYRLLKPQIASRPPFPSFVLFCTSHVLQDLDSRVFSRSPFSSPRYVSSTAAEEIDPVDEETESIRSGSGKAEVSDSSKEPKINAKSVRHGNKSAKKKKKKKNTEIDSAGKRSKDAVESEEKPENAPDWDKCGNELERRKKTRKPLYILFKEAAGMSAKAEDSEISEDEGESKETNDLKKRLRDLEREVRNLRQKAELREMQKKVGNVQAGPHSLHSLFLGNEDTGNASLNVARRNMAPVETKSSQEDAFYPKELLPEMVLFVNHLHEEGYLNKGNLLQEGQLHYDRLSSKFSQDFLKFAAEKFGQDHQEIAKWLSGCDLKKVALFGCPSLDRKTVFAAKSLRSFFSIQEDTVCRACKLKSLCKYANQNVGKREKLILVDTLRVVNAYAFDQLPHQLAMSEQVKVAVSKVLKDVVNLSKKERTARERKEREHGGSNASQRMKVTKSIVMISRDK